jgi:hypothetical protein
MALRAEENDRLERERRRAAAEVGAATAAAAAAVATDDETDDAERDIEEDAASEAPSQSPSAESREREARERQAESSGGPHDETETGGDPDGGDMVEHLLASGAEVASGPDGGYVAEDAEVGPETETTAEGLTETSTASEEGR